MNDELGLILPLGRITITQTPCFLERVWAPQGNSKKYILSKSLSVIMRPHKPVGDVVIIHVTNTNAFGIKVNFIHPPGRRGSVERGRDADLISV